ncbi:MAG: SoxR reducing system RseC family protein [Desulfobacterales bacterium]
MAERTGLVLQSFDNGMAEVVTDRRNACGGCEKSHGCRSCLTSAKLVATVQNPVSAVKGDVVLIHLTESALRAGAVLLYIIPILWLMAGAFVGDGLGGNWRIGATGAAVLGGLTGLAIGFIMARSISRSASIGPSLIPRIVRVVERGASQDKRAHAIIDTHPTSPCCG